MLAARLGRERVISIDDQSAARQSGDQEAYGATLTKVWDNPATKARVDAYEKLLEGLGDGDGLLRVYRAYNVPSEALLTYQSDFGATLSEHSPEAYGRSYVGCWETRNLRTSGNIRDALTAAPGARALVIIGASHKGYVEAYLDRMHDVKLADVSVILD